MKRDHLAQTWQEKFMLFEVGEEYLYQYQKPEQLEKAREAVESENRKNEILLLITFMKSTNCYVTLMKHSCNGTIT